MKCELFRKEINYLGQAIGEGRILTEKKETKAVQNRPNPQRLMDMQSIVKLHSYWRRFICVLVTLQTARIGWVRKEKHSSDQLNVI